MAEDENKKRTTRGGLWHALLVRRSVVLVAFLVLVLSSASWLWDEVFPSVGRPRLIEALRWFPWYAWVIAGLVLLIIFIGEHAYRLIRAAEQETEDTSGRLYDGRPLFVFDVVAQPAQSTVVGRAIFKLKNCGVRPARWVSLHSLTSNQKKHRLHFEPIPLVDSNGAIVEYSVDGKWMHEDMLCKFLKDNQPDTAVTWWDVTIEFRDTDESVRSDIARFCYDVESGQIFVRAVPYTERGFKPPS